MIKHSVRRCLFNTEGTRLQCKSDIKLLWCIYKNAWGRAVVGK